MQPVPIRIFLILLILALVYPSTLPAATEQRIALVIGNSAYSSGPLKNPVNDATDLAAALNQIGFAVTLKKNANLQEMMESIEDFGNSLKRGGVGLFYYAGHGVQVGGVNYLLPISARINKESDVRFQAVDAGKILAEMENANNGLNIVILDACRDNPFGRSFRSSSRGLAIVANAPSGTFISYSTGAGQVAMDGEGRNSPYTSALLENIAKPGLTINKVFMNVRSKIKKETGQVPWELSSLEGDFYFARGSMVVEEPPVPLGARPDAEGIKRAAKKRDRLEGLSFQVNYVVRPQGTGDLRPIKKGDILRSGDHYKVLFSPDKDSYVYIFQVDSTGAVFQLFPMKEFKGVALNNLNPVKKGKTYILPASGKAFILDKQAGIERIYFVASKERNTELEGLYAEVQKERGSRALKAEGAGEKLQRLFTNNVDSQYAAAEKVTAKEGTPAGTQEKLNRLFRKRGVEGITTDRAVQVPWQESGDVFSVMGQKLENLGEENIHVLEFVHQ